MNGLTAILVAVTAFVVTSVIGVWLIPFLKRVKYGQTINDIGPTWHKNKQGTPTMGGFMFITGVVVASVLGLVMLGLQKEPLFDSVNLVYTVRMLAGLVMALLFGCLGFLDDYIKVVKKRNLGLTARQKLVMQVLIAMLYLVTLYLVGDRSTIIVVPFLGQFDIGLFYYPLMLFIIVGVVNAVNLTDGIDGLCGSVTFVVAISFMIMSAILGLLGINILATALAGACLGFLLWNFHPAKVFMGDTGSLFLGGLVAALGFGIGQPVILVLAGLVYMLEALSDIIQIISFKSTGKRVFKMAPIHHHFEMSGFSEMKIVGLFSLVAAIGCVLAVVSVYNM